MKRTKAELQAENKYLREKINNLLDELRHVRRDIMEANYQLNGAIKKTFDAHGRFPYVKQ